MSVQIKEQADGSFHFVDDSPFEFEAGGAIASLTLAYETWGELNEARDNAILVHHALSTSSHLTSTDKYPDKGWWEDMVGPSKPIDSDRYHIICVNSLGSCFGTTGPASINPATNELYRLSFPILTVEDVANSAACILDHIGVSKLHTVIGSSDHCVEF